MGESLKSGKKENISCPLHTHRPHNGHAVHKHTHTHTHSLSKLCLSLLDNGGPSSLI
jgi:hypothetical protein